MGDVVRMYASEDDNLGIGYKTLITRLALGEEVHVSEVSLNAMELVRSGITRKKIVFEFREGHDAVFIGGDEMIHRFGSALSKSRIG